MIKNKNVLISTAEKNLILNSSICTRDNSLKEILLLFPKSINNNNLDYIKSINSRIYQIIKGKESREELIGKSSKEWKNEKPIGIKKQPCELCENAKSELKYIILNTITKKRLEVGSSCILKFPGIKEKYHGESTITMEKWLKDSPEKITRLGKFADRFSGGKDIFEIWKVKYDAFEIEFPKEYDVEFRRIKSGANKVYSKYIKGQISEDKLVKFQYYIDEFNYFYKKCERFYEDSRLNQYICTKDIAKFLKDKRLNTTLNNIKERGCIIPKGLAPNISDVSFVRRFENRIKINFNKYNIELEKIDSQFLEFSYKYKTFEPLKFIITTHEFVKLHSGLFYDDNILDFKICFKSMILKNEPPNIYEFLGIIEYYLNIRLKKRKYTFQYDVELHEKKIAELHKKKEKVYANIDVQQIRAYYIQILYLSNEEIVDFLNVIIQELKWITYEERDKNDIGDISSVFTLGKDY